ncbi:MAG: nitroreductase family protein, partial [Salinivirgaceae bacterium]|nr:nitroreductase family protein [Salinivirgaceae bacterium]
MEFDVIANLRKSIRSFTEQKLNEQQISELKETILKVPSAKAIFPWRCYFITNEEKIATLSKFKGSGSGFIKNAAILIIITADTSLSDMWIEDCSIVGTYLLLKAVDMQLGACWVQVRNRQHDDTTSARRFIMDQVDI